VQRPLVLVVSSNPVLAALIGGLVELADVNVAFPQGGEAAGSALRRIRPAIVVADCDHPDTASEAFIGPALMTGARIALFCSARHAARERTQATADRHGLAFFVLPDESDALQSWVASAAAQRRGEGIRRGA
jgi:DNA-binding NtrC family response regulator